MSKFITFILILTPLLNLGCSLKQAELLNVSLAGNRRMSFGLRKMPEGGSIQSFNETQFVELLRKALVATYGANVFEIKLEPGAPITSPNNLYPIATNQTDDLFVVEISKAQNSSGGAEEFQFSTIIYNGQSLRAVNIFSFKISEDPANLETSLVAEFKKASLAAFPNPNIYPRFNPLYYADLLYKLNEDQEKKLNKRITCETASDRLKYYSDAKKLYDLAVEQKVIKAVKGSQGRSHELSSRQNESAAKSQIIEDCRVDADKNFEINIRYSSVGASSQAVIQKLLADLKMEELLKQYTNKPVTFQFQIEKDGTLSLFVDLRFDSKKYKAWRTNRIPAKIKNFAILSFDPYYALMQKLVAFRSSLPPDASLSLRSAFKNMRISLNLITLFNGQASLSVDGKMSEDGSSIHIAYPNSVYISLAGFTKKLIQNRDPEIFREKGWIALGSCKTIEESLTEDGLAYEFFDLPCN
jgi:hypothetical protein